MHSSYDVCFSCIPMLFLVIFICSKPAGIPCRCPVPEPHTGSIPRRSPILTCRIVSTCWWRCGTQQTSLHLHRCRSGANISFLWWTVSRNVQPSCCLSDMIRLSCRGRARPRSDLDSSTPASCMSFWTRYPFSVLHQVTSRFSEHCLQCDFGCCNQVWMNIIPNLEFF